MNQLDGLGRITISKKIRQWTERVDAAVSARNLDGAIELIQIPITFHINLPV